MPEIDVTAYKEQVFGNGQPSTHTPTPTQPNNTASSTEPPKDTIVEPTVVIPETTAAAPVPDTPALVDENLIVKERLGYDTWDAAKAEIETLKQKASTPAEIKYANDQSKLLHEAIVAGKTDDVYEILDTQRKIAAVDKMDAASAIKLHIQQNNKHFKNIDVEDVFEEKYSYPEKPIKGELEEDSEFISRETKWKEAKEKIDRRIERDSATAKTELQKLSAELKLPTIPNSQPVVDEAAVLKEQQAVAEMQKLDKEAYSKLSPKDVSMVFKFNDEANKLSFDVAYEPEKDSFDSAITQASDLTQFFANFYDKDGNPDRSKQAKAIYAANNIEKIVTEAMVQAVNQERIRALKYQKNIGDGVQRNYTQQPLSDVDKLRQQVFGK